MDTKLNKSTNFHPQTDGQTEVINYTMVQLLRGYCAKHINIWYDQLYYVQHAYNCAIHSFTKNYLVETWFGYFPKSPLDFVYGKDFVEYG